MSVRECAFTCEVDISGRSLIPILQAPVQSDTVPRYGRILVSLYVAGQGVARSRQFSSTQLEKGFVPGVLKISLLTTLDLLRRGRGSSVGTSKRASKAQDKKDKTFLTLKIL